MDKKKGGMSRAERSAASRDAWERKPARLKEAQLDLLTAPWDIAGNRELLSQVMRTIWRNTKDSSHYSELVEAVHRARGSK